MIVINKMTDIDRKRKIQFKALDKIYNSAIKTSKAWGSDQVYLVLLKEIIDKSKIKLHENHTKADREWIDAWNRVMSSLYKTCKIMANKLGERHVPKIFLKNCIDEIKKAFIVGSKIDGNNK